mmetsp:Transcript_28636/g.44331  ORF Transcript_28636/g.44331 Transcript_28636/m.44331 type:complete len:213 (-) Transcript_28636:8-646(-)
MLPNNKQLEFFLWDPIFPATSPLPPTLLPKMAILIQKNFRVVDCVAIQVARRQHKQVGFVGHTGEVPAASTLAVPNVLKRVVTAPDMEEGSVVVYLGAQKELRLEDFVWLMGVEGVVRNQDVRSLPRREIFVCHTEEHGDVGSQDAKSLMLGEDYVFDMVEEEGAKKKIVTNWIKEEDFVWLMGKTHHPLPKTTKQEGVCFLSNPSTRSKRN